MSSPSISATTGVEFAFWQQREGDNRVFNRLTWLFLVATLSLAMLVKMTQLPEITRAEKAKIPPQLTKIIERITLAPKPEVVQVVPVVEPKPVPAEEAVETTAKIVEEAKPSRLEVAQQQASSSGLLAMADDLAAMREMAQIPVVTNVQSQEQSEVVAVKAKEVQAFKASATAKASVVNAQTTIANASLVNREVMMLADKTPQQAALASTVTEPKKNNLQGKGESQQRQRKIDVIRLVLDRNKGAFYTIYRRALRQDPTLEGKVTMMIIVEPDGRVSGATIVSSALEAPALERKLIARVKLINFGQDVSEQTSISYSFNFLPY